MYHGYKDGKYLLPNDLAEQDRLDFQYKAINLILGELALAPMTQAPRRVLDIGTGTGIWAIDFALENPSSQVVGVDLSRIQPDGAEVPDNCRFEKADSEDPWRGFKGQKFDYIHLRMMFSCFHDHRTVIRLAFENMEPGAWIEYQDSTIDAMSMNGEMDGPFKRWSDLCYQGALTMGRDIRVPQQYKQWLTEAGFVDVQERRFIWPLGRWPETEDMKLAGDFGLKNLFDGARGGTWKMLRATGMSVEEVEALVQAMKEEVRDLSLRAFFPLYVVYGRKPFPGEVVDPGPAQA